MRKPTVRVGTSDETTFREVYVRHCYRLVRAKFDVEAGETWLDLGANVGAFAHYCLSRGAEAVCYEPDPDSFRLLSKNAEGCEIHQAAVTVRNEKQIPFFVSSRKNVCTRGSEFGERSDRSGTKIVRQPQIEGATVPNVHMKSLCGRRRFDGIKMDIEGSEGPILDAKLLPWCEKFVMEYHTSLDPDMDRLRSRLDFLKTRFRNVHYPPEIERALNAAVGSKKTYFDRTIFAWGAI